MQNPGCNQRCKRRRETTGRRKEGNKRKGRGKRGDEEGEEGEGGRGVHSNSSGLENNGADLVLVRHVSGTMTCPSNQRPDCASLQTKPPDKARKKRETLRVELLKRGKLILVHFNCKTKISNDLCNIQRFFFKSNLKMFANTFCKFPFLFETKCNVVFLCVFSLLYYS